MNTQATPAIPFALQLPVRDSVGTREEREAFARAFVEAALNYAAINAQDDPLNWYIQRAFARLLGRPVPDELEGEAALPEFRVPSDGDGLDLRLRIQATDAVGDPILPGGDYVLEPGLEALWLRCGAVSLRIAHDPDGDVRVKVFADGHEDVEDPLHQCAATQNEARAFAASQA